MKNRHYLISQNVYGVLFFLQALSLSNYAQLLLSSKNQEKMDKIYGHLLKPTKEKTSGSLFFYLSRVGSMVYVTFSIIFQLCSGIMLPLTCTESQNPQLPKDFITMHCSNQEIWTMDGNNQKIKYHR